MDLNLFLVEIYGFGRIVAENYGFGSPTAIILRFLPNCN